tara:strand:- start:95 stop:673 length:579 start_codon:yes stop_codon:yes gene_type:complete
MVGPTTFGYQNLGFASGGAVAAGSLELIAEASFSGTANVQIQDIKEDLYDVHFFHVEFTGEHQGQTVFLDMSVDGGSSYITDDFMYAKKRINTDSSGTLLGSADLYGIVLYQSVDNNNGALAQGYIYHAGDSSKHTFYSGQSYGREGGDDGDFTYEQGGGVRPAADVVNCIRFYPHTGNMAGKYKIFGIKKS